MTTLRHIGEMAFIERVHRHLGTRPDVIVGPGDDCAVVRVGDRILLITCDLSMEGVHFRRGIVPARDVGWKAATSSLSDIAAMGGVPLFMVTSVAAPADTDAAELEALCAGMAEAAESCGAVLVGGDTARSSDGIVVDVTVVGEAPEGRYVLRKGARPGDLFAVTGWPGRAAAGLEAQERKIHAPELIAAHYHPVARIREGQWLARQVAVHAMIDVSDGPVQDGGHLCEQSGLGLAFTSASVAVDPMIADLCPKTGRSIQEYVFTGGEAYELGFAIDPDAAGPILNAFRQEFRMPVTVLGQFSDSFSGVLIDGAPPADSGYLHFA
jgi:thiamine-monophosphate kinase